MKHRAVLDHVGGLSTIVPVDTRRMGGDTGVVPVVRRLRAARYDVAIDAQGLLKSALLARLAGARRVVGLARGHLREPLAGWAYDDAVEPAGPHVVDHALALARGGWCGCGGRRGSRCSRPRRTSSHASAATLGLGAGQPFAVINPGAAWPNKRWPPERFGAVARDLRARHGWPSIVAWGPGEEDLARAVVAAAGGAAALAPMTSLGELLAIVGAAGLVVSGDTGPLHLAAALGTPIVGIYGPTDPARNGPWSPADVTLSRNGACACHHQRRCTAAGVVPGGARASTR